VLKKFSIWGKIPAKFLMEEKMIHIVIDLEMNPISRDFKEVRNWLLDEVIEIGAVKLNEEYQPFEDFQSYVRPDFGTIKPHITKLTGITDETVSTAGSFSEVFQKFFDWIGTWEMKIYSWSNSDINQLKSECAYKIPTFDVDRLQAQWVDIQKDFDDKLGVTNHLALKHAIGAMNRDFEGIQHTALADATNTAAILTLMQDDAEFRKVMQPVIDMLTPHEFSQSIGDLYPELMNLKFD